MKKLLVILMLGAEFVTVASAGTLDCTNNTTNQCCTDYTNISNEMTANREITTSDNYYVFDISANVVIGNNYCQSRFDYLAGTGDAGADETANSVFQWTPGNWVYTIKYYSN